MMIYLFSYSRLIDNIKVKTEYGSTYIWLILLFILRICARFLEQVEIRGPSTVS